MPALSCGMQDLYVWHVGSSYLTREWTQAPCIGSASLSHWPTKGVPSFLFMSEKYSIIWIDYFYLLIHHLDIWVVATFLAVKNNSAVNICGQFLCRHVFSVLLGIYLGFPGGSDGGKESACNQETQVQSPIHEDPLEKGMATHYSILAWRIPWTVYLGSYT